MSKAYRTFGIPSSQTCWFCKGLTRWRKKEAERISEEIMTENISDLRDDMNIIISEAQQTPRCTQRDPLETHDKLSEDKVAQRILKALREKQLSTYKASSMRFWDFFIRNFGGPKAWAETNVKQESCMWLNCPSKVERKVKDVPKETKPERVQVLFYQ